jgi:ABC-2 type transport system ATP-binding protein
VLTTHYMDEAEVLCDRVAVMDAGKILRVGPPRELVEELGVDSLEDVFLQLTGREYRE